MKQNCLSPLLSILIPTKNRANYTKHAILNVLKTKDVRLELVVQDNSDDEKLRNWININIEDSRLIYNHSIEKLSFISNFNKAIDLSNGIYVCIIGDDDGINPEIVDAARLLEINNIDCLSINTITNYVWPNSGIPPTFLTKKSDSNLYMSELKGYFKKANVDAELNKFISNGAINYLNYNLPKLYHGIVKKESLDKIKDIVGNYLDGLSPDIFASISLSCILKRVYVTDYPLTIPGVCSVSASVKEGLLKTNSKKLSSAPHFNHRGEYHWSEIVPPFYTVETIWADSSICALNLFNNFSLLNKFNYIKLSSITAFSNNCIIKDLITNLKIVFVNKNKNVFIGLSMFYFYYYLQYFDVLRKIINRIYNRILMIFNLNKSILINDINNIYEASNELSIILSNKKTSFSKVFAKNFKNTD